MVLTAFIKSQIATGVNLPQEGVVFLSVRNKDKDELIPIAKKLKVNGNKNIKGKKNKNKLIYLLLNCIINLLLNAL